LGEKEKKDGTLGIQLKKDSLDFLGFVAGEKGEVTEHRKKKEGKSRERKSQEPNKSVRSGTTPIWGGRRRTMPLRGEKRLGSAKEKGGGYGFPKLIVMGPKKCNAGEKKKFKIKCVSRRSGIRVRPKKMGGGLLNAAIKRPQQTYREGGRKKDSKNSVFPKTHLNQKETPKVKKKDCLEGLAFNLQ